MQLNSVVHVLTYFFVTFFIIFITKFLYLFFPTTTDRRKVINAFAMLLFFIILSITGVFHYIPWIKYQYSQDATHFAIVFFSTMLFVTSLDYFIWDGIITRNNKIGIPKIITNIFKFIIYFFSIIITLHVVYGMQLSGLLAATGLLTFILGIASQSTLSNLFAGLALQFGGKLKKGEYIKGNNFNGVVSEFNWRSVTIIDYYNKTGSNTVVVPNTIAANDVLTVYSHVGEGFVAVLTFRVYLLEDISAMLEIANNIIHDVAPNASPYCDVWNIDDNTLEIAVSHTVYSCDEMYTVRINFFSVLYSKLLKAGLTLALPRINLAGEDFNKYFINKLPDPPSKDDVCNDLSQVSVFNDIGLSIIQKLVNLGEIIFYAQGEIICGQDNPGSSFFILLGGSVLTLQQHAGKRQAMRSLSLHDVFGLKSFLLGEPRRVTVQSDSNLTWVIQFEREDLQAFIAEHPDFLEKISAILIKREMENKHKMESLDDSGKHTDNIAEILKRKIRNLFFKQN